jgi:hypothetical protein
MISHNARRPHCLFLTRSADRHADLVGDELQRRGTVVHRWNIGDSSVRDSFAIDAITGSVTLRTESGGVSLDEVETVWLRRPTPPPSSDTDQSPGRR